MMRFAVESWAPDYGAPVDGAALDESGAAVDLAVERSPGAWSAIDAAAAPPAPTVLFVDGVQRVDARVWVTDDDGTHLGVCASWAAGVVRCNSRAEVVAADVRRGVLCPAPGIEAIATRHGEYRAYPVPGDGDRGDPLHEALGRARGDLEGRVAAQVRFRGGGGDAGDGATLSGADGAVGGHAAGTAHVPGVVVPAVAGESGGGSPGAGAAAPGADELRAGSPAAGGDAPAGDELLVVDGPLGDRRHIPGAVGYVKAHHVSYLPPPQQRVVAGLAPGQRTPLFTVGDRRFRYSWYLRLPGTATHPWWGVVRCEASGDLDGREAMVLADRVTATLPRFASQPHTDPRAPQNLHPIAGLERELRRHLGDPLLLDRALRQAATAPQRG